MVNYDFLPHIPDDTNKMLFIVQGSVFQREAFNVFNKFCRMYIDAANLIGIKPELYIDLMDHKLFNPNPFWFEYVYNHMAAYYRYRWDDHGQIPLPFPGFPSYRDILEEKWINFFTDNIEFLLRYNQMISDILKMFLYHDSNEAKSALERIIVIVQAEFPLKNSIS